MYVYSACEQHSAHIQSVIFFDQLILSTRWQHLLRRCFAVEKKKPWETKQQLQHVYNTQIWWKCILNELFFCQVFFFCLSCQPPPAFSVTFTKCSLPLEYYIVWISEHVLCQKKEQFLCLKKLINYKINCILASCILCYHQHLKVGTFHKNATLNKKLRKSRFCQHLCLDL